MTFSSLAVISSLAIATCLTRTVPAAEPNATTRPTPYANPIVPGFAPDPSVCRVGEDFYLANSSFTMLPGLPIYHSRDLVNWQLIGHAIADDAQASFVGSGTDGGIYAPTLRHHGDTFYLIVKNTTSGHNELYTTADPARRWMGPTRIGPDWDGDIDPDLFFDNDGTAYVSRRIGIGDGSKAEHFAWHFDTKTARVTSDKIPLWNGTGKLAWPEGGHLYRHGAFYYYQLAEGGTAEDHRVTIARKLVGRGLDDASQKWEPCPANPILYNDAAEHPAITCTGHADQFDDASGHAWMVLLGRRQAPLPDLARETYLAPVEWVNDWPVVNGGKPITSTMTGPLPASSATRPTDARDEFDAPTLAVDWNFLRTIDASTFSVTEHPGSLTLHGKADGLDSKNAIAWVGRRLRDKSARVTTQLDFAPTADGQFAGINLFGQVSDYAELIVRRENGRREAVVRVTLGEKKTTSDAVALPGDGPVQLAMTLHDERITFRASADDGKTWQTVRDGATKQTIAFPNFTGLYVGMHAVGEGATARFEWFECTRLP